LAASACWTPAGSVRVDPIANAYTAGAFTGMTGFSASGSINGRRIHMRGHCLCGAVAFEVDGPAQACVVCHCESCRRQCSAPMTTYIGVLDGQWRWLSKPAKVFNSSPGVERTFCDHCGSPLSFRSKKMSDVMHFFAAAMEEPEKFAPTLHVAFEEKLPWLKLADGLPTRFGPDYTKG
jgi:hypothetical protein